LLANSTFEGTFYFSQAPKAVDIPHQEEKKDLFCGIFPHFLNSPTVIHALVRTSAHENDLPHPYFHRSILYSTLANFTLALLLDMWSVSESGVNAPSPRAKTGVGSFVACIDLALEGGWCEPRQKWPKSSLISNPLF